MKRLIPALLSLLLILAGCTSRGFIVLSYNTETFFDDVRNGTEFAEFNPDRGKWNSRLFRQKLQAISRVLREAVPGGADVIALQEIENSNVLNQLNNNYLKSFNYKYAVLVPAAGSAINVAVLSRYPVSNVKVHNQQPFNKSPLRNILEVQITYNGSTLILFNNHWKSKGEGAEVTEAARLESADLVKRRISSLLQENPAADILVAGDFNENPDEYILVKKAYQTALIPIDADSPPDFEKQSLFISSTVPDCSPHPAGITLFEPWSALPGKGSYYYKGKWEQIDHILLSCGLSDSRGFSYRSFEVVKKPFMLNSRTGIPLRWDMKRGGFSDHLPVVVHLITAE